MLFYHLSERKTKCLQVEMNVGWQQGNLRKFCEGKGIHMCAWSPLGANGASWGTYAVMESPILKDVASAMGKSVAQVNFQNGISCLSLQKYAENKNLVSQVFWYWKLQNKFTSWHLIFTSSSRLVEGNPQ